MAAEPQLHLLLELEAEAARWRRRTLFLFSILIHALMIIFLLVSPDLLHRLEQLIGVPIQAEPKQDTQTTYLTFPPELVKPPLKAPDTNALSDQNRRAQGRSPIVNPFARHAPVSQGNTPLPEVAGGPKPAPPPSPPPAAPSQPAPNHSGSSPAPSAPPPTEAKLKLMDVPPAGQSGQGNKLQLPAATPAEAIRQSLEAAARGRSSQGSGGAGDSPGQFSNPNSNFSTEGPVILSDTRGVDFGPYLRRIVYVVRINWYAVIPESARLGEKGRVSIDFDIQKDGSVPELVVSASSGSLPLDRAAIAGLRASIPFPPLPTEFSGDHLRLRFIFLYNLGYMP
jgi:TonB family protein